MSSRRKFLLGAGALAAASSSRWLPASGAGGPPMPQSGQGLWGDLQRITAAAGDAVIGKAHAQAADDYRALVCIFMFGGNDGNNLLVPGDAGQYGLYSQARGPLTLSQASLLPIAPTNTGGQTYGLHPATAGLQNLFRTGRAGILANVGTLVVPTSKAQYEARSVPLPQNLFSHSDQQAQWQTSISDGGDRTGWAGRIGDLVQSMNTNRGATCISLSGANIWENGTTLTSYKVSPNGNFGFNFYKAGSSDPLAESITEVLATQRGHPLEQAWLGVIQRALENQRVMSGVVSSQQFATGFPNSSLGSQLRMAARLIAARGALGVKRQTIFCSIGGFDTHGDDQLARQQQLLGEISAAVSAFYDATVTLGVADKVTTFTASDFGRNLQSNGKGSDHGWGSHHFVVGGAVRGGAVYGTYPNLALSGPDDVGSTGVWIPTLSVDQYAATLAKWFGVSPTDMATVLPNLSRFPASDLGFMA